MPLIASIMRLVSVRPTVASPFYSEASARCRYQFHANAGRRGRCIPSSYRSGHILPSPCRTRFRYRYSPTSGCSFAVVRQRRNEIHAADIDAHRTAVERFLLIAEIERGAETVAAVIKPQRSQRGTAFIIINSAFTLAVHRVDPGAELVVVAETPPGSRCRPPENQRYSRRQRARSADLPPASARG